MRLAPIVVAAALLSMPLARPQGIQPAGFRQLFVGLEWAWPST